MNIREEKGKISVLWLIWTVFSIKMLVNTDVRDPEFVRDATFATIDKIHEILEEYDQLYCSLIRHDIRKAVSMNFCVGNLKYEVEFGYFLRSGIECR